MKKLLSILLFTSASIGLPAYADNAAGKALIDQACQQCHDNGMYSRSNSILQSYPELQARVEFCENASKAHWADAQINQVIEYLNDTYYKFPKP